MFVLLYISILLYLVRVGFFLSNADTPPSIPPFFFTCTVILFLGTLAKGRFNNVVKVTRPLPYGYGDLWLELQRLL